MKPQSRSFLLYCSICFVLAGFSHSTGCQNANQTSTDSPTLADTIHQPLVDSLSVFENFVPSGWMGDGEDPSRRWLKLDEASTTNPKAGGTCLKVAYTLGGTAGWAGIYWHNVPDNWCKSPGEDFSKKGFTKITFWARGENGGELIEFKAGGIKDCSNGGQFDDSFGTKAQRVTLEKEWKEYSIDLTGQSLESVIGGFCWSAPAPSSNMVFYLDEVYYR